MFDTASTGLAHNPRLAHDSPALMATLFAGLNNAYLPQVFYDATHFFSREGKDAPGLTDVIPAMDIINEKLATNALDQTLDPAIRVAVSMGKHTVNHYYNKTDETSVYCIAMGM